MWPPSSSSKVKPKSGAARVPARAIVILLLVSCKLQASRAQDGPPSDRKQWSPASRLLVWVLLSERQAAGDSFQRLNRSAEAFELSLEALEMARGESQGRRAGKLELIRGALEGRRERRDLVVMLLDGPRAILNGGQLDILERFDRLLKRTARDQMLLLSADPTCWPEPSLEAQYPALEGAASGGDRFLSSAALIGHAPVLWDFISSEPKWKSEPKSAAQEPDGSELQRHATGVYLDEEARRRLNLRLDHRGELFENLRSTKSAELELEFSADEVRMKKATLGTEPVVVHGSGSVGEVSSPLSVRRRGKPN